MEKPIAKSGGQILIEEFMFNILDFFKVKEELQLSLSGISVSKEASEAMFFFGCSDTCSGSCSGTCDDTCDGNCYGCGDCGSN